MILGRFDGIAVEVGLVEDTPLLDLVGVALIMLDSRVRAVFVLVAVGLIVCGAVVVAVVGAVMDADVGADVGAVVGAVVGCDVVVSDLLVEATVCTLVLAVLAGDVVDEAETLDELCAASELVALPDDEEIVLVFDVEPLAVPEVVVVVGTTTLVSVELAVVVAEVRMLVVVGLVVALVVTPIFVLVLVGL